MLGKSMEVKVTRQLNHTENRKQHSKCEVVWVSVSGLIQGVGNEISFSVDGLDLVADALCT